MRIQSGEQELMEQLWEQVRRLVYRYASGYLNAWIGKNVHFTLDDLVQSGYLGVVSAVQYYDPDEGLLFATYLKWTLTNEFRVVAGIRTSKRDPLDECSSLDAPINSSESESDDLYRLTPDRAAAKSIAHVEHSLYREQLRAALDDVLYELPERTRNIIKRTYYARTTFTEQAILNGVSKGTISLLVEDAFAKIRRNREHMQKLASFLPEYGYDPSNYREEDTFQERALKKYTNESSPFLL